MSDTVFFKHKYLTQPTVPPEDTIVAAAQQLTAALKGNAKDHKELQALKKWQTYSKKLQRIRQQ